MSWLEIAAVYCLIGLMISTLGSIRNKEVATMDLFEVGCVGFVIMIGWGIFIPFYLFASFWKLLGGRAPDA
jgi:hypothetical protein